jgi:hypothetical protein
MDEHLTDSVRSTRIMTDAGQGQYAEERDKRLVTLDKAKADLDIGLASAPQCADVKSLRQASRDIVKYHTKYKTIATSFVDFLSRAKTDESLQLAGVHANLEGLYMSIVDTTLSSIDNRVDQLMETASVTSRRSSRTNKSSSSHGTSRSNVADKRVKADAARARAEYAEKEAEIRRRQVVVDEEEKFTAAKVTRKKAELEVDFDLLQHQKEAAVAEAEACALQGFDDASSTSRPDLGLRVDDSRKRTELYVSKHAGVVHDETMVLPNVPHAAINPDATEYYPTNVQSHNTGDAVGNRTHVQFYNTDDAVGNRTHVQSYNTDNAVYNANTVTNQSLLPELYRSPPPTEQGIATDLTRFLLKKDLLISRLTNFNDKPETYATWKASFQTILRELEVSPPEEMDLLVKWAGPESQKHVLSIKASNASNPERGLLRIWERLEERYGSPEMVEASLKRKLSAFPKLTNKDNTRLYDLADIVSEIESVKEDERFRSLLAYFDSSTGVIPIVNKLPYGLQERWTGAAVKYMKVNKVPYPPFTFFAEFVREQNRIKNNPSFAYESATTFATKSDNHTPRVANASNPDFHKHTVWSKKTDVAQDANEPDKRCPIHKTKHSLNQCNGFRSMTIQERREVLKEHGICFRCCASTKHSFQTCKEIVQCSRCSSERHCDAMHNDMGARSKPAAPPPSAAHGGEQQPSRVGSPGLEEIHADLNVTSTCTQICSDEFSGKSCAKTVLAKVYPSDSPELAVKVYAILDDQSNRSLVKPELLDILGIHTEQVPYKLSSCAGSVETFGRRASGLVIESLDSSSKLDLPTLIECNQIPQIREEIPTPEVAQHHPHLNDIAEYIPPMDDSAEILLLIGRDLLEAHHIFDQRVGPRKSPFAQKLRLGWVIVGEACIALAKYIILTL